MLLSHGEGKYPSVLIKYLSLSVLKNTTNTPIVINWKDKQTNVNVPFQTNITIIECLVTLIQLNWLATFFTCLTPDYQNGALVERANQDDRDNIQG